MSGSKEIIEALGGATVLAKLLGYPDRIGAQRVSAWAKRGIPPQIKAELISRLRERDNIRFNHERYCYMRQKETEVCWAEKRIIRLYPGPLYERDDGDNLDAIIDKASGVKRVSEWG